MRITTVKQTFKKMLIFCKINIMFNILKYWVLLIQYAGYWLVFPPYTRQIYKFCVNSYMYYIKYVMK